MATKKETTKKKNTTKKNVTSTNKYSKLNNSKTVSENVEINKEEKNLEKPVEVVNVDPSVLPPTEDLKKEEPKDIKEENVVKNENDLKKIIKNYNQSFDYLWNGQIIDF